MRHFVSGGSYGRLMIGKLSRLVVEMTALRGLDIGGFSNHKLTA